MKLIENNNIDGILVQCNCFVFVCLLLFDQRYRYSIERAIIRFVIELWLDQIADIVLLRD